MLASDRPHPAAGNPWFDPEHPHSTLKNLKMCPSVANPSLAGHHRCARGGGGAAGGAGGGSGSNRGGAAKLHMMRS